MQYWPGTKIPKSTGNAFDWRAQLKPSLAQERAWRQSTIGARNAIRLGDTTKTRSFTVYSRVVK